MSHKEIVKQAIPWKRETCCLYYLINKGRIVYIGSTDSLSTRLKCHHADGKVFDSYHSVEIDPARRYELESIEIFKYVPLYNFKIPCTVTVAKLHGFDDQKANNRSGNVCRFNHSYYYVSKYNGHSLYFNHRGMSESEIFRDKIFRERRNKGTYSVKLPYTLDGAEYIRDVAEGLPTRKVAKEYYLAAAFDLINSVNFQI